MSIEVANESGISVDEPALAALARFVLDELRMHPLAELSVVLVDAPTIADLHQRWLGEEGPTDVLAFPMDELRPPPPGSDRRDRSGGADTGDAPNLLGDVVLCPEVATKQAREAQHPVAEELELLCTHGILHLLGFDHAEPDERATMFGLQDRLLGSWRAERAPDGDAGDAGDPGEAGTGDHNGEREAEARGAVVDAAPERKAGDRDPVADGAAQRDAGKRDESG